MTPETLVKLDRKVSRALCTGKGIKLTGDELSILAELGMIEQLSESKAKALKEQGRCRQLRVVSTNEDRSGSILSAAPMAGPRRIDGTSGGTTRQPEGSSGEARAHQIFG